MNHGPRRLPRLPILHPTGPTADADLLARWAAHRDESAFELIVRRHGPLVLASCRRVLSDANDADDAFQATFLVLARKASSIARGEVLAGWLHRVASRAALRIRTGRVKRTNREEPELVEQLPAQDPPDPGWRELERVLDEEITRLPARQRAVFVLCCLEGKTGEEAGRLLGCPPGTVSSRLTRAREQIRDRLTRRGFAPAVVVAALAALTGNGVAAVPSALIGSTVVAALNFAAGRVLSVGSTPRPAAIAQGVIQTMTATRLKFVALLIAAGLLAVGGVFAASQSGDDPSQSLPNARAENAKAGADDKRPPIPVVQVIRPQAGGIERISTQSGVAEAVQQAQVLPAITGVVSSLTVDIGDRVKRGQILGQIDAPSLALDDQQARIGVQQAKGLLKEAEARAITATAEIEASKVVAKQREVEAAATKQTLAVRKKQFDRTKLVADQGKVSQLELDEAEALLRTAEAQVDTAMSAIENAKADMEVKKGKLLQAEAAVATAKSNVEAAVLGLDKAELARAQTMIRAPFDGIITRRNCSPGDYVVPVERGAGPLFTMMRTEVIRMVVSIPGRDIALVEPGVPAEVTFAGLDGVRVTGKVARIGFALDPKEATMRAEIDVPNPKGNIRPGMFGSVTLKLGKGPAEAVHVPVRAVVPIVKQGEDPGIAAVYVYCNGKARLTRVRVGWSDGKQVEILSGLTAEDRVVLNPKELPRGDEIEVEVEKPAPPK
jgi:HlyD family secretion protein